MASSPKKRGRPAQSKAQKERARAQKLQKQKNKARVLSVLLMALGAFLCAVTLIKGENLWFSLHSIMHGLFGIMSYGVGPLVILLAVMTAYERRLSAGHTVLSLLTLFAACGAVMIFGTGLPQGETFGEQLESVYLSGSQGQGGGVAAIPLGWTLLKAFGQTGAGITVVILLFVFVMLLTGKTISGILGGIKRAAQAAKERSAELEEISRELKDQRRKVQEEKKARRLAQQQQKKAEKLEEIKQKGYDIPLDNEPLSGTPIEVPIDFQTGRAVNTDDTAITVAPVDIDDINAPRTESEDAEEQNQRRIDQVVRDIKTAFEQRAAEGNSEEQPAENGIPEEDDLSEKPAETKVKYKYPPINLLKKTAGAHPADMAAEQKATARKLVDTLESFGVKTKVMDISRGPTVTRYELQPSQGVKVSRISSLADDIALNLASAGVRIEAPIPNKAAVGIEVPNRQKAMVGLRAIIESEKFRASRAALTIALGLDIDGEIRIADIAEMPHMLVAGTTGSGKSVCLNAIILSLVYKSSPEDVRMILVDPKSVELTGYNGIPHLLVPVVTDPKKAAGTLTWAVSEMMKRYRLFAEVGVKSLDSFNRKVDQETRDRLKKGEDTADLPQKLPRIVIIIDELSDLMMVAPGDVEDAICRLAQLARAAGMHLIVATQRPTVDVVTGLIKANIPSRVAFAVKDSIDSRTIIGSSGAEKLLGKGDMLYMPIELNKPVRLQGCYVSEEEIASVIDFLKAETQEQYSEEIIEEIDRQEVHEKKRGGSQQSSAQPASDGQDSMLDAAIEVVVEAGQASVSLLQRKLKLGYARAARIVDEMEQMGVVGPSEGSKPRSVNMTRNQWLEMKMRKEADSENQ